MSIDLFMGMVNVSLVVLAVGAKMLTAHLLIRQKTQVARLQATSQQIVFRMKSSNKRLKSLQNTRDMMQRKRTELKDSIDELKRELAEWEARSASPMYEEESEDLQSTAEDLAQRVLQGTAEEEEPGMAEESAQTEQNADEEQPADEEEPSGAEGEPVEEEVDEEVDEEGSREIRTAVDRRRSLFDDPEEDSREIRTYIDKIREKKEKTQRPSNDSDR